MVAKRSLEVVPESVTIFVKRKKKLILMMKLGFFLLVFVNQNNLELKEELDILENALIH